MLAGKIKNANHQRVTINWQLTTSMTSPFLIVGLGNPGAQYAATRHNAGFMTAEHLCAVWGLPPLTDSKKTQSRITRGTVTLPTGTTCDVIVALPQTFMNRSGAAVAALCAYYKVTPDRLIVLHDESDFAVGRWSLERDRGAAGHNGVTDIMDRIASRAFLRLRIGIRPAQTDAAAPRRKAATFVLEPLSDDDARLLRATWDDMTVAIGNVLTA